MRILVIGGTRFIGPPVVRRLHALGHEVALFHRGNTEADLPEGVRRFHGDRAELLRHEDTLRGFAPDVALDMIPYRVEEARAFAEAFRGVRTVALSSADVYLAFGRIHRTEPGPRQPLPLTEDSELRATTAPHGDAYDKIGVERALPDATILRLPAVHGPGDPLHRLHPYLKRMDDGRPAILLGETQACFRWVRGYVENVAEAIVLAVTREAAAGRVYNVAEPEAWEERAWVRRVGDAAGWTGEVEVLPDDRLPAHLRDGTDHRQHYGVDTYRIRHELGFFEVVSRAEALRRTIEWERAHPPAEVDPSKFDYAAEGAALDGLPEM